MKCSVQTNIIEYSKKDQLVSNPAVVLYFCDKNTVAPNSSFRTLSHGTSNIFIEAKDPSWTNFANAITIQ